MQHSLNRVVYEVIKLAVRQYIAYENSNVHEDIFQDFLDWFYENYCTEN